VQQVPHGQRQGDDGGEAEGHPQDVARLGARSPGSDGRAWSATVCATPAVSAPKTTVRTVTRPSRSRAPRRRMDRGVGWRAH
jgi:hypothetical protein